MFSHNDFATVGHGLPFGAWASKFGKNCLCVLLHRVPKWQECQDWGLLWLLPAGFRHPAGSFASVSVLIWFRALSTMFSNARSPFSLARIQARLCRYLPAQSLRTPSSPFLSVRFFLVACNLAFNVKFSDLDFGKFRHPVALNSFAASSIVPSNR